LDFLAYAIAAEILLYWWH